MHVWNAKCNKIISALHTVIFRLFARNVNCNVVLHRNMLYFDHAIFRRNIAAISYHYQRNIALYFDHAIFRRNISAISIQLSVKYCDDKNYYHVAHQLHANILFHYALYLECKLQHMASKMSTQKICVT